MCTKLSSAFDGLLTHHPLRSLLLLPLPSVCSAAEARLECAEAYVRTRQVKRHRLIMHNYFYLRVCIPGCAWLIIWASPTAVYIALQFRNRDLRSRNSCHAPKLNRSYNTRLERVCRGIARVFGARGKDICLEPTAPTHSSALPEKNLFTKICKITFKLFTKFDYSKTKFNL